MVDYDTFGVRIDGPSPVADPAQYTPGTWHWHFMGTAGRWMLINEEGDAVQLGGPPDLPLSPDQVLTQSAPELLEALQDAQTRLALIARLANYGPMTADTQKDIYNLAYDGNARRAIAKATTNSQEVPR